MKRLFKNVNTFGLLGMLVMGLLVFTQSAFKSDAKHLDSTYYFNGTDNSDIKTAADWGASLNTDKYSCDTFGDAPCQLNVPDGQTLQEYLDSHTESEILAASASIRVEK
ncbi:MAG TPA: hypothetical protein VGC08_15285 [Pedobacter sp.]